MISSRFSAFGHPPRLALGAICAAAMLHLAAQAATQPAIGAPAQLNACTEQVACAAQQFSATGGVPPYAWSASGLPSGMTLASDGALSGTPAKGSYGTYNLPVTVQDSAAQTATRYYLLIVSQPLIIAGPSTLPPASVGVSYGPVAFQAAGGTAAYSWEVSSGALPAGLALSSSGVLSGTPAAGTAGTSRAIRCLLSPLNQHIAKRSTT